MRFMTVDNVLQYNTQIPSGQPRDGPVPAQRGSSSIANMYSSRRTPSGGLPNIPSRTGQPMPSRTTKISEKLVLLPDTQGDDDDESELELLQRMQDEDNKPLRDEELDVLRKRGGIRGKSYAERLPKMQRKDKVSRLTAYCTAQAFKIKQTAEFLRKTHDAKTKLYDDCLYVIYALPLMNGTDGYRVRGRPILKTPGTGKTVLDLEIERSEQSDHHEGYFEDDAFTNPRSPDRESPLREATSPDSHPRPFMGSDDMTSPMNRLAPNAKNYAEMFVYSYGVVVFWNFTEYQEKDILADLTFADAEDGINLITRPLDQDDYENEEFHFEYSADAKRPRIFNDMITLMPRSDHMIKLTISHAIAQSTKLCFFEERMSETMLDAQDVPKNLALTGELSMTRVEIVKILGRLFKSRVDINLCKPATTPPLSPYYTLLTKPLASNILDVPNFFWDSEPTLHPLYAAIREYLEIDLRIKVLNERCRVFLDLAEILSDSVADAKMSSITWIVIILILVSILVTVTEVGLRFALLERNNNRGDDQNTITITPPANVSWAPDVNVDAPVLELRSTDPAKDETIATLELLAMSLGLPANASLDDVQTSISELQRSAQQVTP